MSRFKKGTNLLILGLILLLTFAPMAAAATAAPDTLNEVKALVDQYYVDVPAAAVDQATTIDGLLQALGDAHSEYFTAQEYEDFTNALDQKFVGIGIYMDMSADGVKVTSVIAGSPAEKAGLKSGDVITAADGKSLSGMSGDQAAELLRGVAGSKVALTIKRSGQLFKVTAVREEIEAPTVSSEVVNNGQTGYIAIADFGSDTAEEFGAAVKSLEAKKVKSWIVDLRDNPGGYLDTAFNVAGYFIGDKPVIKVQDRTESELCPGVKQDETIQGPVVLLVNENSASASEVLTGSLKYNHRVVVMGTNTYGKGTVQQVFQLSNGDVVKFTVARFFTPDGGIIDHRGIAPDIVLDKDADTLQAAEDFLSAQTGTANGSLSWQELDGVLPDVSFYINLPAGWSSSQLGNVKMVEADNSGNIPVQVKTAGEGRAVVTPGQELKPGGVYWLIAGNSSLIKVSVIGN